MCRCAGCGGVLHPGTATTRWSYKCNLHIKWKLNSKLEYFCIRVTMWKVHSQLRAGVHEKPAVSGSFPGPAPKATWFVSWLAFECFIEFSLKYFSRVSGCLTHRHADDRDWSFFSSCQRETFCIGTYWTVTCSLEDEIFYIRSVRTAAVVGGNTAPDQQEAEVWRLIII